VLNGHVLEGMMVNVERERFSIVEVSLEKKSMGKDGARKFYERRPAKKKNSVP
jgi:hypothetical protein